MMAVIPEELIKEALRVNALGRQGEPEGKLVSQCFVALFHQSVRMEGVTERLPTYKRLNE